MTPEEYERFKEAEKEHLRKLKKLKEAARVLERQKKIAGAVTDMTTSMQDKFDEHREMVERLGMEAARTEARMEVAMDSTEDQAEAINREAEDEEVLRKARARELIRRMQVEAAADVHSSGSESGKSESNPGSGSSKASGSAEPASSESESGTSRNRPDGDLPEKTIGRMKP